jgi:DNA invertase Pin-like site-specific DNA recombinase
LNGDVTDQDLTVNFTWAAALFSALEKRKSAERIKGVKQRQRKQGRYLGGSRPFGYMIHENGRLIENPMEQRVLKKIMELKRQGKSLRAISSEVSTPVIPISFKTVQRLLQRHSDQVQA